MDSNKLNKILVLIVCVIIIVFIVLIVKSGKGSSTAELMLYGESSVSIHQYDNYDDLGCKIINQNGDGFYIKTEGEVDTSVIGTYVIKYNLYNKKDDLLSTITRNVYVLPDDLSSTRIVLKGDKTEYYFIGDYKDSGFVAYRNVTDVSNIVRTNSDVDNNKAGRYTVEYYIDSGNSKKSVIREVYIVDLSVKKDISKQDHIINLLIDIPGYDYVILPNNETSKGNNNIKYKYATGNLKDEYIFDIYLKSGSHQKYIINKSELGVDILNGTCSLSYENKTTKITMHMDDISLVSKFRVGSEDFTGDTKIVSGYKSKVTVGAYNQANQVTSITCTGTPPTATPKPQSSQSSNKFDTGIKSIGGHTSGNMPCGVDVTQDNINLDNEIKKYGYTSRGAVATAGIFLANYRYNITYQWAGKYFEKGLNPRWGCSNTGLDCTGFVKWAFVQAGFDSNIIPRSGMGNSSWGSVNASNYLFAFNESNLNAADYIKPGDIVTTPYVHVGLVIGVDGGFVQVAQESTGINVVKIRKRDGKLPDGSDSGITHFVLLDEFYNLYGKQ